MVGAALGFVHPRVLDAHLLAENENLLAEPIDLRLQPDPGVDAVRGGAASAGQGCLCQRDRVDHGGANPARPVRRERNVRVDSEGGQRIFGEGIGMQLLQR